MPDLPSDVLCYIRDYLHHRQQLACLSTLLQCSRALYDLIAPTLYSCITLTRRNARQLFCGLSTPPERLIRRQRKVPSAPPDIHWRRFLSREFYIEWAGLFEAAPDEGLRSRREYVVWPKGDAESEDEEEETGHMSGVHLHDSTNFNAEASWMSPEKLNGTRNGRRLSWPHPTYASHKRKEALLGHIKMFTIESIPSRDVCDWLNILIRGGDTLFSYGIEKLIISSTALWTLIDWEDRHPRLTHPFRSLWIGISPKHVCMTYPAVDLHLEKSYMLPRIVTNQEHLSRQSEVDQYTYLRFKFSDLLRLYYGVYVSRYIDDLFDAHPRTKTLMSEYKRFESLIIHNVSSESLPTNYGTDAKFQMRIFSRPCACNDEDMVDKVVDTSCYDHWTEASRLKLIRGAIGDHFGDRLAALHTPAIRGGPLPFSTVDIPDKGEFQRKLRETVKTFDYSSRMEWVDADWEGAACLPLRKSVRVFEKLRTEDDPDPSAAHRWINNELQRSKSEEPMVQECLQQKLESCISEDRVFHDILQEEEWRRKVVDQVLWTSLERQISFKSSDTAEGCVCCGAHQKRYSQVRFYRLF